MPTDPPPTRDPLDRIAAFCEQTARDGVLPSLAWFAETATTIRAERQLSTAQLQVAVGNLVLRAEQAEADVASLTQQLADARAEIARLQARLG